MSKTNIKEVLIEIDGERYHGFLYKVSKESPQSYYLQHIIEELDLSVRTYNCLRRAYIRTFQDLKQKDLSSLYKVKNLGKKSLRELYEKVYKVWLYIIPSGSNKDISDLAEYWRTQW